MNQTFAPLTLAFAATLMLDPAAVASDDQVTNLASLGLSGMQVVSDAEGMEVRGMAKKKVKSYAFTSGKSKARRNGQKKKDKYSLGGTNPNGPSFSSGSSSAVQPGGSGINFTFGGATSGAF